MNDCIDKPLAPAFPIIQSIPEYVDWFKEFCDRRNEMKVGIGLSIAGPQWDVGVGFVDTKDDNSLSWRGEELHIRDLALAI